MKLKILKMYFNLFSTRRLIIMMDQTLNKEMSYELYYLRLEIIDDLLRYRIPNEEMYASLCDKYLGTDVRVNEETFCLN